MLGLHVDNFALEVIGHCAELKGWKSASYEVHLSPADALMMTIRLIAHGDDMNEGGPLREIDAKAMHVLHAFVIALQRAGCALKVYHKATYQELSSAELGEVFNDPQAKRFIEEAMGWLRPVIAA